MSRDFNNERSHQKQSPSSFSTTQLRRIGKALLTVALLLIGLGLSRAALRQAGTRALAMGLILWLIVSVASLLAVRATL